ncbi:MAG: hypothetical protein ABR541_03925 [Candidatus Dormibacteria bacterium]
MPTREIVGKTIGFSVVALGLIVGGILALIGPRAYTDYLINVVAGVVLILLGLLAGGLGVLIIGGIIVEARRTRREAELHIADRPGPLGPPPAWGMGEIGRVDQPGVVRVGDGGGAAAPGGGGGSVRVMSVSVRNLDAPLIIVGAIIWTALFTFLLAPR